MRRHDLRWLNGRLPDDLRALTIRQPWASLIVEGHKLVENRNQPLPKSFLGEVVAIHAGARPVDQESLEWAEYRARRRIDPESLPTGAIIGFARLVGSIRRAAELPRAKQRWFDGPHGWLLDDVTQLPEPVPCGGQLGFWRVPRRVQSRIRSQVTAASSPTLRVFSWGYKGWGTSIAQALEMFDVVEKARGFGPPLFVDIRARREVRSEGFTGPRSPFIRALGPRYRWLRDLGNAAVTTGRGRMRLIAPDAIGELLGVVLRAQTERRRVVFFCSCESPRELRSCHRRLVAKHLAKAAGALGLSVSVEEWPGGAPRRSGITIRVDDALFEGLCRGASAIDLGRRRPPVMVLSLSVGSIVKVKSGRKEALASVLPPVVRNRRWRLPLYLLPFDPEFSARTLTEAATRARRADGLEASPR